MSYKLVNWNTFKFCFDAVLLAGMLAYVLHVAATYLSRDVDQAPVLPIVLMRATATLAFVLLHVVLCIGLLARLDQ